MKAHNGYLTDKGHYQPIQLNESETTNPYLQIFKQTENASTIIALRSFLECLLESTFTLQVSVSFFI